MKKKPRKDLGIWIDSLWGIWEEAVKLGARPITLGEMERAFRAGFEAGRESVDIIPRRKKKS